MLQQMRPQLEAAFAPETLRILFANVRNALIHGLHLIFLISAILMSLAVLLHVALRGIPLKGRKPAPETEPAVP